jgi:DNA-binding MarR family transcriptional regulator
METTDRTHARLGDQLCFALYSASKAVGNAYRSQLAPLGLTYPQYLVMLWLWANDGSSVVATGRAVGLETSTLSPLLKRLEQAGFIARRRDEHDERVVRLQLTDTGRSLEADSRQVRLRVEAATGLDPAEFQDLHDRLVRLQHQVESLS